MSLKPQPPRPLPPEMAIWGATHLDEDDPYKLIGDLFYEGYRDEDFADLYHKEGKPALSPMLVALVLVLQALENLSDRKAACAVECHLKWKYALHLPLDDYGFDASVLCEFRKRLLTHSAEARVFDQVLVQMQALGLLTPHGIQRTDSLAIDTHHRLLGAERRAPPSSPCQLYPEWRSMERRPSTDAPRCNGANPTRTLPGLTQAAGRAT